MSFTPGPWTAVQHYGDTLSVIDAAGFEVVEAESTQILLNYSKKLGIKHWADSEKASRDISDEEQAANARLIAAAPDLLAACMAYLAEREAFGLTADSQPVKAIRAAISKAVAP